MSDRPDYFTHVLPDLVRETNWLKEMGVYTTLSRFLVTVPAGESVVARIDLPDGEAWYMHHECHGDIPLYVFKHKCVKDGKLVIPEQLIGCANIYIWYPVPYVVKDWLEGTFTNTDTVDWDFELVIFYAVVPAEYVPPYGSSPSSNSNPSDPPLIPPRVKKIVERIRKSWYDEGFPKGTRITVYYQDKEGRRYLALRKVCK